MKYVAEFHALGKFRELNQVFTATLAIYTATALVAASALAGCAGLLAGTLLNIPHEQVHQVQLLLYILAFQMLFELPALTFDAVVSGLQRYDVIGFLEMGRFLVLSALMVLAVQQTGDLVRLGLVAGAVAAVHSLLLALLAWRLLPQLRVVRDMSREVLGRMFRLSGDLFLLRINAVIYNNMDGLLIGALVTTSAVADYDIANRIHSLVVMVMGVVPMVALPAAASFEGKKDLSSLKLLVVSGTKYTMALTVPLCLVVWVLAEPILCFWISPVYREDATLVRLFLVYLLFWPIQGLGWNMLIGVGETKALVRVQLVSVAVNLVVTVILLPLLGTAGAMIGTAVGNLVAFFPYLRLILRRFDVQSRQFWSEAVWKTYLPALAVAAVLAVVVGVRPVASRTELIFHLVVSLTSFFVVFAVTGVSRDERQLLLGLIRTKLLKSVPAS